MEAISVHLRDGLTGSRADVAAALKIREDFLLEAAGKGRLWEVRHYLPPEAKWWIDNKMHLWKIYDSNELQLLIREAMAQRAEARRGKIKAKANEKATRRRK